MPRYKKDIEYLNTIPQPMDYVRLMMSRAPDQQYKCYIGLLYLTGARPIELQHLKIGHCKVIDNEFIITLPTAKNGFTRTLKIAMESPFLQTCVLPYIESKKVTLDDEIDAKVSLFTKAQDTFKRMVWKLSENNLTPYSFRHHRMTKLAELGAYEQELKYWKGARDSKSVEPYIHRSGRMVERFKNKIE